MFLFSQKLVNNFRYIKILDLLIKWGYHNALLRLDVAQSWKYQAPSKTRTHEQKRIYFYSGDF